MKKIKKHKTSKSMALWVRQKYQHKQNEEVLFALKKSANFHYESYLPYKKRRITKPLTKGKKKCFVCKKKATQVHHIISIAHGGTDDGFNRIPLCVKCHKEIHPFMEEYARISALTKEENEQLGYAWDNFD